MSKAVKNWLIVAAVLIWVGILIFCWVMSANHWDFSALNTAEYEQRVVEIPHSFENISILSETEDIARLPSPDGKCRVEFVERKGETHTAEVQDGTLTIQAFRVGKWTDTLVVFSTESARITLYLPEAEYTSLYIKESTGDIDLPAELFFESVRIQANTGDVKSSASVSGLIRIDTDTGDIRLRELTAGELTLSVSTGSVEIRGLVCAGDAEVTVSTGKATLTDLTCANLRSKGSTGRITLENVVAEDQISIERSTGDVLFTLCDASELLIETDTGSVTGSLLSEKVFIAHSDTGRVEVPETVTGGKCKVTTDTGSIRLTVEGIGK